MSLPVPSRRRTTVSESTKRHPPKATDSELRLLQVYEAGYSGYDAEETPDYSPHHPKASLSQAQINDPDWKRFWKPKNFLAKVVEEPVGYLGTLDPHIAAYHVDADGTRTPIKEESEEDKALLSQISRFVELKIKPRQADLVLWQGLYGRSFAKVIYDPGRVTYTTMNGEEEVLEVEPAIHVIPYPRIEGNIERAEAFFDSEDPDRVTSAVVYWIEEARDQQGNVEERKFAQLLYPDRIEWLELINGAWYLCPEKSESNTGIDPHTWGVVPIAVFWNNGKPDMHDGIDAQIAINKDLYDMAVIQDGMAFPQRWRKGVIPVGGWKRNPLTNEPDVVPPLKSGPFIMWDVPTEGEMGQLPAATGDFVFEKYKTDVRDLATLTSSVAVAKMHYSSSVSGESKSMDTTQQLTPRIDRKAEALAAGVRSIFAILRAMAADAKVREVLGFDPRGIDIDLSYPVEIDRDQVHEDTLNQQDVAAGNMSKYTYLRRRGMTDAEAQQELKRLEEQQTEADDREIDKAKRLDPLAGATGGMFGR